MEFTKSQVLFMRRALQLSKLGRGLVSPNPMVGCVIVKDNKVIGEGWHEKYGENHAEVNAVAKVKDKSLLQGADVYVTLEPCAHYGNTPPCADLLVRSNVKNVFIACIDPNPLVCNIGAQKLRDAGIKVFTGLLEEEAIKVNERFFTSFHKKRPYIILKYAQTSDGFVARENFDSKWISHAGSRKLVHKWRAEEDAILVGKNTALHDNPQLNVRDWEGSDPLRILIDHKLSLKDSSIHLLKDTIPTICFNTRSNEKMGNVEFVKLEEQNFLIDLLSYLHKRKIQSIIVEGGARTLEDFINAGLWDEARVFTAPVEFKKGIKAPIIPGKLIEEYLVKSDKLSIYLNSSTDPD